jgi:hypothetical protein
MVSCNFWNIIRSSYYFQTILFSNDRVFNKRVGVFYHNIKHDA